MGSMVVARAAHLPYILRTREPAVRITNNVGMRKYHSVIACLALPVALALMLFGGIRQEKPSSRAYVGHENDRDIKNLISQFPKAAGTRLDDCQTCHRGGIKDTDTEREFNPCGYCHLLEYPNPSCKTGVRRARRLRHPGQPRAAGFRGV